MTHLEKPLVSIVMPAYNAEALIAGTIRSVQAQTVDSWELLVIDDCSIDRTAEIVAEMAREDPRIRLYTNEGNLGTAASRNRGMALRRGEYVAFLDSDDTWRPEKLALQLECFRRTGAELVYSAYAIVDKKGQRQCRDFLVPGEITFEDLLKENVIGCSTVMLTGKTQAKFREDVYHEDYVLWLELLQAGCKAAGVEEVTVDYYYHTDSKAGNKGNAALERWKIYRRHLGFSPVKSLRYFVPYALAGLRKYRKV